jgi:Putative prokaryotic signal transducing protein
MATPSRDDIVQLTTAPNPAEAHLWQQVLEEEGIRAQVVGDYLDAGIGDIPGFRAEVWVHRDDVERARAILQRAKKPEGEEADEETEAD